MRHTDDEIERAASRFEQLADELDPANAQVDHTEDLRAIAAVSEAVRADEARLREAVEVALTWFPCAPGPLEPCANLDNSSLTLESRQDILSKCGSVSQRASMALSTRTSGTPSAPQCAGSSSMKT